jgi:hypothetical protein
LSAPENARNSELSVREIKNRARKILESPDFEHEKERFLDYPPRQVINPLISFLCYGDRKIFHRSVISIGMVVDSLAGTSLEEARVIMRRFMWMLNDESGGIGWGVPEAMAEIMALNERLAQEYSNILISYMDEEGNYLEYEALQRGLLWGVARLAEARPKLMQGASAHLRNYLESPDPVIRYHACRAAGFLSTDAHKDRLRALEEDAETVRLFMGDELTEDTVGSAAREALSRPGSSRDEQ